MVDLQGTFIN
uniref:Uncharacterized protein n=1 Tax=Lepeophtheirus salmonis TaxID=72036 RepID=A0A0K2TNB5_LEPSM